MKRSPSSRFDIDRLNGATIFSPRERMPNSAYGAEQAAPHPAEKASEEAQIAEIQSKASTKHGDYLAAAEAHAKAATAHRKASTATSNPIDQNYHKECAHGHDCASVKLTKMAVARDGGLNADQDASIANSGTPEGVKKEWETRHHGTASVLPIGKVNLTTHDNPLFGKVWHGWKEGEGTNILMHQGQDKMRAVHTSGSGEGYNKGDTVDLKHDQTFRPIGDTFQHWYIIGKYPHSSEGMSKMKADTGKNSLPFMTFK